MIEDEIVHWYKDDKGETHRSSLGLESEGPQMVKGFPRDGLLTVRLNNSVGNVGFRMSPDEALRFSTVLQSVARELLLKKRGLWQQLQE
jgi:hypothetical protein